MNWRLRFSFPQYIGFRILLGLLLSFLCLAVFAQVADQIFENDTLVSYDLLIANHLHNHANPIVTNFLLFVTRYGFNLLWLITLGFAIYFIYKYQWLYLFMLLLTTFGSEFLNQALKRYFSRPRPSFEDPIIIGINYSFPSGHAMTSLVAYGLLAYFLVLIAPSYRLLIFILTGILVGFIGFSRIYLGVHYLSDVIAGYAAGGFWLGICLTTIDFIRQRRKAIEDGTYVYTKAPIKARQA